MEKQKLVMVLLIVTIVLSAATIVVSMSADTNFEKVNDCSEKVNCLDVADGAAGQVSLEILPNDGGTA